jgi:ribonuclease P protein component
MPSIVRKLTQFTKKEIDAQFQRARRVLYTPAFTILFAPRSGEYGRVLIIASRKVGSAPERNKLRRRIKSIFYEEKLFEHPYDCIIILRKEAVALSFVELRDLLLEGYKKGEQIYKDELPQ